MRKILSFTAVVLAAIAIGAASLGAGADPVSPLADYPGFGHNARADEARFEREERQRETLMADCMKGGGFKYFPSPSILVTGAERQPASGEDRNDRYVASLTPAQRLAYYFALTGTTDPADEESSDSPSTTSCVAQAFRTIPGVFAARQALAEEFEEMEQAIATDPRVSAATSRWSSCMRQRGFDTRSPGAIENVIDDEVARMLAARRWDEQRLRDLDREQSLARKAARGCDPERLDVLREVRIEFETAFADEHRAVLDSHEQG